MNEAETKKAEISFNKYAGEDGKLNQDEFNQVFYSLGIKGLAPGAFKAADLDNDGTVDKIEFFKFYAILKRPNDTSNSKKPWFV